MRHVYAYVNLFFFFSFLFFLICDIFIEIYTFVSSIHKVPVPYPGLVNISKAHIYKDISIC